MVYIDVLGSWFKGKGKYTKVHKNQTPSINNGPLNKVQNHKEDVATSAFNPSNEFLSKNLIQRLGLQFGLLQVLQHLLFLGQLLHPSKLKVLAHLPPVHLCKGDWFLQHRLLSLSNLQRVHSCFWCWVLERGYG